MEVILGNAGKRLRKVAEGSANANRERSEMFESGCLMIVATIGLVVATLALVVQTGNLVGEAKKQREEAKAPLVSIELLPGKEGGGFMDLVLANVGRGTALNVSFHIEADEADFNRCRVGVLRGTSKPFNFLLPGTSMDFDFGVFDSLVQRETGEPLKPFHVTVEYEDCDGNRHCENHVIDIRTYDGLTFTTSSVARDQKNSIENIRKTLENTNNILRDCLSQRAIKRT